MFFFSLEMAIFSPVPSFNGNGSKFLFLEILLCIASLSSLALDGFDQQWEALPNNVSQQPKENVKHSTPAVLLCVVYLFYCVHFYVNEWWIGLLIISIIIITISFIITIIIIFKVNWFTGKAIQAFHVLFSLC